MTDSNDFEHRVQQLELRVQEIDDLVQETLMSLQLGALAVQHRGKRLTREFWDAVNAADRRGEL